MKLLYQGKITILAGAEVKALRSGKTKRIKRQLKGVVAWCRKLWGEPLVWWYEVAGTLYMVKAKDCRVVECNANPLEHQQALALVERFAQYLQPAKPTTGGDSKAFQNRASSKLCKRKHDRETYTDWYKNTTLED